MSYWRSELLTDTTAFEIAQAGLGEFTLLDKFTKENVFIVFRGQVIWYYFIDDNKDYFRPHPTRKGEYQISPLKAKEFLSIHIDNDFVQCLSPNIKFNQLEAIKKMIEFKIFDISQLDTI